MIKTLFPGRLVTAALAAILLCLGATAEEASVLEAEVRTHPSQGEVMAVQGAKAMLVTTKRGAFASLATRQLHPGNAYTLWWVVINNPAACEASPCEPPDVLKRSEVTSADVGYADGLIAADDGTGHFVSHVPVGPLPQAWFGAGLERPTSAEIHLVINDHGPLLPSLARSMLTSYRGGCTDQSLPQAFPATAQADGTPGPNTCRLVQTVIFAPAEPTSAGAN